MPLKCTRVANHPAPPRDSLTSPAPPVRPHKAAHAEIAKHDRHPHRSQKMLMSLVIRTRLMPIRPHLPCATACKQREDPEEDPRKLQPQHAGQLHERPPHRFAKSFTSALQSLTCLSHLLCGSCRLAAQVGSGALRRSGLTGASRRRRIRSCRGIHRRHQRLRCCTSPHPKRTTKANRIHSQSVASRRASENSSLLGRNSAMKRNPSRLHLKGVSAPERHAHRNIGRQRNEKHSLAGRRLLCRSGWLPPSRLRPQSTCRTSRPPFGRGLGRQPHHRGSQLARFCETRCSLHLERVF